MRQESLIQDVVRILDQTQWRHAAFPGPCFDLVGEQEGDAVLLKALPNVDSATKETSEEMRQAAAFLGASPLIVGEKNGRGELEKKVVYERYGIPTISAETLEEYLRLQHGPIIVNTRGGHYVSVDREKLEEKRKEAGYSVNALAKEIGVSTRTVLNYREQGRAEIRTAERLEAVLGPVWAEIDLLERKAVAPGRANNRIAKRLLRIGFDASGFAKAPFDAAARDKDDRFVATEDQKQTDERLLRFLQEVRDIVDSVPFMVTEQREDYAIPSVTKKRLQDVEGKEELKEAVGAGA